MAGLPQIAAQRKAESGWVGGLAEAEPEPQPGLGTSPEPPVDAGLDEKH